MAIPTPEVGLVISYGYLWHYEHQAGQEEGRKDRPCVITEMTVCVKRAQRGYRRGNGKISEYFLTIASRWSLPMRLTCGNLSRHAHGLTA
jgi:hypothetical protein